MAASNDQVPRLALLIDADNISSKYLSTILSEVPKHGIATYRRIYGDFTDPQAAGWRTKLLDNAITPVQQFSNVKSHKPGESAGKNATDSTLIIDAMDILYAGKVDGFIIVSSDSDFTRLAQRLRESGMHVVGMGRNQTSVSFRRACTTFVNIELLASREEAADAPEPDTNDTSNAPAELTLKDVERVVAGIVRNNDGKGEDTPLGAVGNGLHNRYPDFDVRTFGYTKLSKMIGDMKRFEIVENGGIHYVSFADTRDLQSRVTAFVRERLSKEPSKTMQLSALANEVYQAFPNFSLKDAGYAQFSKFADSIKGVKVVGANRQQARLVK
ncbi:MAG: NYN domain-containing protein [Atopobiaceae bacterium]|nr:NYN domain-containing protein [Atopobiaceae bacterium]